MRRFVTALVCSVGTLLGGATTAGATPITWTLQNFAFTDGGLASGSFVYDADTNLFTSIAITTTAGAVRGGDSYGIPGVGNASLFDTIDALPVQVGVTARFIFSLASPMTNAGGTIAIDNPFRVEVTCATAPDCAGGVAGQSRLLVSGSITTTPQTPEPATLMLLGTGAVGLLVKRRRMR